MQNWNVLDSPETLSAMIPKFPRHVTDRWNRKVLSLRKRSQRKPTLSHLSYFIEEESALVNDPLFSNSAVDECLEKTVKPAGRSLKMNLAGAKEDRNQKKKCQMCQKDHDLDACFKYKQLQADERKTFLMKSKLCFSCYVISKEHSRRNCPKRRKCSIYKEQHPTGLHGLQSKKMSPEKEDSSTATKKRGNKRQCKSMCISSSLHRGHQYVCDTSEGKT